MPRPFKGCHNYFTRKAETADVVEIRRKARVGFTMPRIRAELAARGLALSIPTIQRIIYGKTYRDIPGALTEPKRRLKITDGQVVLMREERSQHKTSYRALGLKYGISHQMAQHLCTGAARPHLPGAVKYVIDPPPSPFRKHSAEQVRHIRASAARKGCRRGERRRCTSMRLGIPVTTITQIVLGSVYKEIT